MRRAFTGLATCGAGAALRLRPLRRVPRRGGRRDVRQLLRRFLVVHQAASQPPSMESAAPFTAPLPGPAR